MRWWRQRERLTRFIEDLIHAELSKLRPGLPLLDRPWPESLEFGDSGLGCDSLERLTLAAALGQALRLDRSGLEDHLLARSSLGAWIDLAEICLERHDDKMVFLTSGSSGQPKPCEHSLPSLERETAFLAELFAGRRRIVATVSSRHIYGFLFTTLLPIALGTPVLRRLGKSTVALGGDLMPGDLVIGYPDLWRLAARSVERFPPDVAAVTSTAPFPRDLDKVLADRGLARLVEIYGSSETAGIGWREAPSPDFRLFPFWTRAPDGETLIRRHAEDEGGHSPQDFLRWRDDGSFRPEGRRDEAFQVGGVNVHPRHVESVLSRHPAVAEVSVRRMRPEEGERVKAFIVPRNAADFDSGGLTAELALWSERHLAPAERPKAFRFGAAIPRDPLGKSADWDAAPLAAPPTPES